MKNLDYSQPDFYRFTRDSILLAELVLKELDDCGDCHILDVGSGCGVIGLEVARRAPENTVQSLSLVEKQEEFRPFLLENVAKLLPHGIHVEILIHNFLSFTPTRNFTHIVCNPPYFLQGQGLSSPNSNRKDCRSWNFDEAQLFLTSFIKMCCLHDARGFLAGREELKSLMDDLGFKYEQLTKEGPTSFYRLL